MTEEMRDLDESEMMVIEKLVEDSWVDVEMETLVEGDIFRMFNPNGGSIHQDDNGETEFYVLGDPYIHPEYKVWTVDTVPRSEAESWGDEDGDEDI